MVDSILPEPVSDMQAVETQIETNSRPPRSNRTLIILLIIILIAFLGLVGGVIYNYVSNRSQDDTRKHDLAYIASQAETFHNFNLFYPTLAQMNSSTSTALNSQGINKAEFKDPSSKSDQLVSEPSPTGYAYIASPAGCNNTTTMCLHFKLVAVLSDNAQYSVVSKH